MHLGNIQNDHHLRKNLKAPEVEDEISMLHFNSSASNLLDDNSVMKSQENKRDSI